MKIDESKFNAVISEQRSGFLLKIIDSNGNLKFNLNKKSYPSVHEVMNDIKLILKEVMNINSNDKIELVNCCVVTIDEPIKQRRFIR